MASGRRNILLSELLNGDYGGTPQQPRQEAVVGNRPPAWAGYTQAVRMEKAVGVVGIEQRPPASQPHPHAVGLQPTQKKQLEWAPVLSFQEWVKQQAVSAKKPTPLEQFIGFMCSEDNRRRVGTRLRALRMVWGSRSRSTPLLVSSLRGDRLQVNKDVYRWKTNIYNIAAILGTSSLPDTERNAILIGIFSERRRHLDENIFVDRWSSYRHNLLLINNLSSLGATRNSVLGLALLLPEDFEWTNGKRTALDKGESMERIVKVPELLQLAHKLVPYVTWVLNGLSESAPPPLQGIEVM
ncbi:hypothetical protein VE00_02506 [Pseudogymnoascus sp. WSF 3629]|nr:hypothetical protein VE00_02506 [Pseudogymnoascus sp. WSF 3629]